MAAARIAGAAVVFGVDRLGEDDRALVAQLLDKHMVARRKIDVVAGVTAAGGAHVLGIERVLEREHDAVHGHRFEIRVAPISGIKLSRPLQRVGQVAEEFADRRCAGRQWPLRGVAVEIAAAGYRPLAADVERGKSIDLAGIRDAGDHAELLRYRRIGSGWFHAAEFERRPVVLIEVGQDGRGADGVRGETQPNAGAHRAGGLGHRGAVLGHQHARDAVEGADAVEIVPDDRDASRPSRPDGLMQFVDRRLFEAKRLNVQLINHHAILA